MTSKSILVCWLFFGFCFSLTLNALGQHRVVTQIQEGKLSKAETYINKKLSKGSLDITDLYIHILLLNDKDCKMYNTKSAYTKVNQLDNQFKSSEEKEVSRAIKDGLSLSSIYNLKVAICENAKTDVLSNPKEGPLNDFLEFFIDAPTSVRIEIENTRNEVAFQNAQSTNSVEAYQQFIDTYPRANQVILAVELRNQLAFEEALAINEIESYKAFIKAYPRAEQVAEATSKIHSIAFENAKEANTSEAFQYFIKTYYSSQQIGEAKRLYEQCLYTETTIAGQWNSYKKYIDTYGKEPWIQVAIDSIQGIAARDRSLEALDYCISIVSGAEYRESVMLYRGIFLDDGEMASIDSFYRRFVNVFLDSLKIEDYIWGQIGQDLRLEQAYNSSKYKSYSEYIKTGVSNELAFVALQRIISHYLSKKDWKKAIKEIDNFSKYFFDKRLEKIITLKEELQKDYDKSILVKNLGSKVNSKGEEYSPIISTNDQNLFFCAKERSDSKGGEDIFVSSKSGAAWGKAAILNDLSTSSGNNAPLCISADGNEILLFDNGDIFSSIKTTSGWASPIKLNTSINTSDWEGDAMLTSDGNHLLFVRASIPEGVNATKETIEAIPGLSKGKIKVSQTASIEELINDHLLGKGVNANNISFSNNKEAMGTFSDGSLIGFPLDKGILLTTGTIDSLPEWNISESDGNVNSGGSDSDLENVADNGLGTFDRSVIEFDFRPSSNRLEFEYIFGSDEYPEYVCSQFNDIFGFFLSGPNPEGGFYDNQNLAIIPETSTYVSVNTVNGGIASNSGNELNCSSIDENWATYSEYYNPNPPNTYQFRFSVDGFTDIFTAKAKVVPNATYHIKLAVADVSDEAYDTYVFIKENSFRSPELLGNSDNLPVYHGDQLLNGDIYIASKQSNGQWGEAKKLSATINSRYTERSPFLHPDMKTLYFSTDGHGGLGKLDVYRTERLYDSCWNCWSEPVNLGKEINSVESDWGYKISTGGQMAYFSKIEPYSNSLDLYSVNLPIHLRPGYVATVSGRLVDSEDEPIEASMRWEDLETGEVIGQSKSDPKDGKYFIVLPLGKLYGYFVDKEDYFPIANNVDLRDSVQPIEYEEDIKVVTFEEMKEDSIAVEINNLFFAFGQSRLLNYSKPELVRLSKIIQQFDLSIQINGHTDNVGEVDNNMKLSEARAQSVKSFLIDLGCTAESMTIVGHGEEHPIASNETESGRAKNRRVEIVIVD